MEDYAPAILNTDVTPNGMEFGGLIFELVGAVWTLPDFQEDSQNLLNTFKTLFVSEIESELQTHIAMERVKNDRVFVEDNIEVFGEVRQVLKETFAELLRKMTLPSTQVVKMNLFQHYSLEYYISRNVFDDNLDCSGVFRDLLANVHKHQLHITKSDYLQGLIHGDLNGMNILIDSQDIVWVIDFGYTGLGHVIKDIIKLESCILFEYVITQQASEYELMQHFVDALLDMDNLGEIPQCAAALKATELPHLQLV